MRPRRLAPVALALLLAGPAAAEPALWAVRSPTATVYLFGTLHVLPKPAAWLGDRVRAALDQSDALYEEADVDRSGAMGRLMSRASDPGFDLWSKLSPAAAADLRGAVAGCHLDEAAIAHLRPWFAAMLPGMCGAPPAVDEDPGLHERSVDLVLREYAASRDKTIGFFETAEEQMSFVTDGDEGAQVAQLEKALAKNGADEQAKIAHLEARWLAGDEDAMDAYIDESRAESPEQYATLFVDRNQRFADQVAELLTGGGTSFVAVGAFHLAGPDSIQAALAARGFLAGREP